jgi:phosphoserine phosphatase
VKKEIKEVEDVEEIKGKSAGAPRVAAFFDLDGTLLALPSLEKSFFRALRRRGEIPVRNCFLWLKEAVQLAPRGFEQMLQANKMYLRGVKKIHECGASDPHAFSAQKSGHQDEGQAPTFAGGAPALPWRDSRLPVPAFFAEGVQRVAWHVKQGHSIVLVSGTLEPLANAASRRLEAEIAARGLVTTIRVCATRLEEKDGRWTGRIAGDAMFGEAKARAVQRIATEMQFELPQCFAYGDRRDDAPMMETVGNAFAVNPTSSLAWIAEERGWQAVQWWEEKELTLRAQRTQRSPSQEKTEGSTVRIRGLANGVRGEDEFEEGARERNTQTTKVVRFGHEASRSIG